MTGAAFDPKPPDEAAVTRALTDVLAGEPFNDSPQLKAFLSYIVNETLAGRAEDLKGYSIATMALGRPESFDPQTDPIVRVQAGRLRQALMEHYEANPAAEVMIRLEKGTYVPNFVSGRTALRQGPAPAGAPAAHSAIAPPAPLPEPAARSWLSRRDIMAATCGIIGAGGPAVWIGGLLAAPKVSRESAPRPESFYPTLTVAADALSDAGDIQVFAARLRDAIVRFDDLVVVGDSGDMTGAGPRPDARAPGWNLLLRVQGAEASDKRVRFSARLLSLPDGRVIWAREFDPVPAGPMGDPGRTSIVRNIASTIAQPYGVIHAHVRGLLSQRQETADPYGCVVQSLDYWLTNDRETHLKARTCIFDRLRLHPGFGPLQAQLAYLHIEEFRHGYNPMGGDPRARALESARAALRDRPVSARSQQALMAAHFANGNLDAAWRAGNDALSLNPNDTEIIADIGSYQVMAGNFEQGLFYLDQAADRNPSPPAWMVTFRAMAIYLLGRLELSGPMAQALEGSSYAPAQMALIMAAYQFRDAAAGKRHLAAFRADHPELTEDPGLLLRRMNFQEATAARVLRDFNAAVRWINEQR